MKIMPSLFIYCFLVFVPVSFLSGQTAAPTTPISEERLSRLEHFVQAEIEAGKIPGAVSLVFCNGEVVYESALGYRNIKDKTPIRVDDLFYIQFP